jgi:translation initiation factor IF-2
MRIYEFAKQKNISSKEVLAILEKAGFSVASHMSVIPDEAVSVLEKALGGAAKPVLQKPAPEKIVKKVVQKVPQKRVETKRKPEKNLEITISGEMPLCKLAMLMGRTEGDLILSLLKKGAVCNRNHVLSVKDITDLAHGFGIKVSLPEQRAGSLVEQRLAVEEVLSGGKVSRWPIVVVMGHVDHGKTSLLDYVRKMNTAAKEKGGITQHLSAYEVDSKHGKIVFLDTPGHEAFSYMRRRGASVTDLVVLVIAADDGIMPQTVEVINHAKEADVPILVAINKIDKVDRATAEEKIKRQLAQHDLLPEDWGGSIVCVPISAKTGEGVEELLEMIVLQAQMMELKADPASQARGFILESKQEKGFGPVATVICLNGTIRVGDYFVCGSSTGRVRVLVNSLGERVSSVGPSIPVQVIGFDNFVSLGDWLTVVSREEYRREKVSRKKEGPVRVAPEARDILQVGKKQRQKILLLIKTDTHGSREAVLGVIKKINKAHPEIPCSFQIISIGIGDVSEKDVELAAHTGAIVVGLHARVERNAVSAARDMEVDVKEYGIIYKMTEDLEEILMGYEEEVITRKKVAELVVRKVFDLGKRGVIAGCYVSDGTVGKNNIVVCFRQGREVGEGRIVSLQRERKTVKEVSKGYECGFITDNFHDWREEDTVHAFFEEKKKRSEA